MYGLGQLRPKSREQEIRFCSVRSEKALAKVAQKLRSEKAQEDTEKGGRERKRRVKRSIKWCYLVSSKKLKNQYNRKALRRSSKGLTETPRPLLQAKLLSPQADDSQAPILCPVLLDMLRIHW